MDTDKTRAAFEAISNEAVDLVNMLFPCCLSGLLNFQVFHKLYVPSLAPRCPLQENIPIEEVFEKLKCSKEGLQSDEVQARLSVFGYNKLEEKKVLSTIFFLFL